MGRGCRGCGGARGTRAQAAAEGGLSAFGRAVGAGASLLSRRVRLNATHVWRWLPVGRCRATRQRAGRRAGWWWQLTWQTSWQKSSGCSCARYARSSEGGAATAMAAGTRIHGVDSSSSSSSVRGGLPAAAAGGISPACQPCLRLCLVAAHDTSCLPLRLRCLQGIRAGGLHLRAPSLRPRQPRRDWWRLHHHRIWCGTRGASRLPGGACTCVASALPSVAALHPCSA